MRRFASTIIGLSLLAAPLSTFADSQQADNSSLIAAYTAAISGPAALFHSTTYWDQVIQVTQHVLDQTIFARVDAVQITPQQKERNANQVRVHCKHSLIANGFGDQAVQCGDTAGNR